LEKKLEEKAINVKYAGHSLRNEGKPKIRGNKKLGKNISSEE